jgi:hypothetical protein
VRALARALQVASFKKRPVRAIQIGSDRLFAQENTMFQVICPRHTKPELRKVTGVIPNLVRIHSGFATYPDAVVSYYEAFPAKERKSPEEYQPLFASGAARLYTISYSSFAIIEVFPDGTLLLAYLWTDSSKRGSGLGARMVLELVSQLRLEFPRSMALYLNAELPQESDDPFAERRIAWYVNIGAVCWPTAYAAADMSDATQQGDLWFYLLAFAFYEKPSERNFRSAALSILANEYHLPALDRRVEAIKHLPPAA